MCQVNHVELSPNYAGTLFGMTNMIANLTGFVTPLAAGAITNNDVSTTSLLTYNWQRLQKQQARSSVH